jgi:uncharacterized protein
MQIARSVPSSGYVKDTGTPKGRGVFASKALLPGELVEVCPVLLLRGDFKELPADLQRVVFNWSRLAGMNGVHALALGYGSMYNHDNPANLRYEASADGQYLCFMAAEDIERDTEMTVNYNGAGGDVRSEEDDWFQLVGVTPHKGSSP